MRLRVHEIISEFRHKMIAATGVNNPIISIDLAREAQHLLDWELMETSRYVSDGSPDKSKVTVFEGIELGRSEALAHPKPAP